MSHGPGRTCATNAYVRTRYWFEGIKHVQGIYIYIIKSIYIYRLCLTETEMWKGEGRVTHITMTHHYDSYG